MGTADTYWAKRSNGGVSENASLSTQLADTGLEVGVVLSAWSSASSALSDFVRR